MSWNWIIDRNLYDIKSCQIMVIITPICLGEQSQYYTIKTEND